MIVGALLAAAGVLLFALPSNAARVLGATLYLACLASLARPTRPGWIVFGASTIAFGGLVYGFTWHSEASVPIGPLHFNPVGAAFGAADMLRVLGLFSVGLLAARWIPTDEFLPLVSRHPFPLYVTASLLRLVPAVREDFERIRRSQNARGVDVRSTWRRPTHLLPVVVPLFVNALRRARDQALALELAGLGRRRP